MTTHKKPNAAVSSVETLPSQPQGALKALVREALQEILEGEMSEALGTGPGERSAAQAGIQRVLRRPLGPRLRGDDEGVSSCRLLVAGSR